jgi:hypothetical protein
VRLARAYGEIREAAVLPAIPRRAAVRVPGRERLEHHEFVGQKRFSQATPEIDGALEDAIALDVQRRRAPHPGLGRSVPTAAPDERERSGNGNERAQRSQGSAPEMWLRKALA